MNEIHNIAIYIDPPHRSFLKDQLFNITNCSFGGDQLLAPYISLREFFTSRGIPVHTADYLSEETDSVKNIYISIGCLDNYQRIAKRKDTILSAFFALECPIVEPSLYRALPQVQSYFKRIFSWSDSPSLEQFTGGPLQLISFHWPQSFDNVHEKIWSRKDRKFMVMINANKLPNIYKQELYTERLRALDFFSRTGDIDLYGVGWDGPPYKMGKTIVPATIRRIQRYMITQLQKWFPDPMLNGARKAYRGKAISKPETLSKYTFAICFENMILKGWITEKIFDCFFAGTIPIYWGAPDIKEHIPQECFIDMRNFANYKELRTYLKSLRKKDIQKYRESSREFLRSPEYKPFRKETFVELFRRIVEEDTEIKII